MNQPKHKVCGNMERTFSELTRLLEAHPAEYRERLAYLREHAPGVLSAYVEHMRTELERANEKEDRPLTDAEVEDLIANTAEAMGWSRNRILAEAVLRLRAAALYGHGGSFRPVTPEVAPEARSGAYRRRHSSIRALALGDIRAALQAKAPRT